MSCEPTRVMDYNIFPGKVSEIGLKSSKTIVNTLNAYSYVIAKQDKLFREALQDSDILVPDGFPVVLAARLLAGENICKIAGYDLFIHLACQLNNTSGKCFFLGASAATLNKIKEKITCEYPCIETAFYSPPYKTEFTETENQAMTDAVNSFFPDVLFVGMTAPKQEKWVYANKDKINAKIICTIGAVFDFYAGTVKRPAGFWINLKLEWFIRFVKEPRRLWKRYLVYSPMFFIDLLIYLLRIKK